MRKLKRNVFQMTKIQLDVFIALHTCRGSSAAEIPQCEVILLDERV
jgi:hypothetical protein